MKRRLGKFERLLFAYTQLRKVRELRTGDLTEPLRISAKQERRTTAVLSGPASVRRYDDAVPDADSTAARHTLDSGRGPGPQYTAGRPAQAGGNPRTCPVNGSMRCACRSRRS